MTTPTVEIEIRFEDAHYNRNAHAMIPAGWAAYITVDGDTLPKWICGDTLRGAVEACRGEYPTAVINGVGPEYDTPRPAAV